MNCKQATTYMHNLSAMASLLRLQGFIEYAQYWDAKIEELYQENKQWEDALVVAEDEGRREAATKWIEKGRPC